MKNKPLFQKEHFNQNIIHNQPSAYISCHRNTATSADFSLDKQIRRMSPAVHERFSSHVPNQLLRSVPSYPSNQYQLHQMSGDLKIPGESSDSSRVIKQLLNRIQKLEARSSKWQKLDQRVQKLENNTLKLSAKVDSFEDRREECLKGKENIISLENLSDDLKTKPRTDWVTRDDLQKQLVGLDTSFKHLLTSFKTSINAEVGDYNMKNKKKFIEITATHLSQKLEQFKSNFLKEWGCQIQTLVKDAWTREFASKNILGLAKQKFTGCAIPLRLRQQLSIMAEGAPREIAVLETVYYLDREGRLLDRDLHYLLDAEGREMRLQEEKIERLRKEGILSERCRDIEAPGPTCTEQSINK